MGAEGECRYRTRQIEKTFGLLRQDFPGAYFILVGPEKDVDSWIQHYRHLDKLYEYFAASDFALVQSGYGKVVELSALGVPFVAIPLDYHFEQEYVMAHRLKHYGGGKLITLRDHSPNEIAEAAKQAVGRPVQRVPTDNGTEVSQILLDVARSHKISVDA
jgi:predicted glycosyltransferase